MKFNQLFGIAMLSLLSGVSYAAVYFVSPPPMTDGSAYYNNVKYDNYGTGLSTPVSDTFNFSIDTGLNPDILTVWLFASNPQPNPSGGYELLINNFSLSLFDSANHWLSSELLGYMNLSTGNYHFEVTGSADGFNGGSYQVVLAAAAVPEPHILALFGLGLVGLALSRRRTRVAARY